ncbi:hypothetical protein GTY86_20375 [Streptomyces sp. SID5770]|uniref:hypothetical protein n=1 Tax=Streptomyces sp. SID5770 TaxID=2690308 RepID=UPI001368694A|nr:hypothetical protein [Streptomyces sp. SID5770]MZE53588.1 hypothetical protein [Streptomyces sp. SID5770]
MATQQPEPSTGDPSLASASTDAVGPAGPDARVGRETLGLPLLSFGVLGVLAALGALHWLAGLSAALIGLCAIGITIRRRAKRRWQQDAGAVAAFAGYAGQTAALFIVLPPLGWMSVSALGVAAGLWLSSSTSEGV